MVSSNNKELAVATEEFTALAVGENFGNLAGVLCTRLAQGVYGVLQLLDLFVADLGVEGVPEFALLELVDAFEVLLIEVGIAQEPVRDVFLVGPEVDASSVQLADQRIGIGRDVQLFLAHAEGQYRLFADVFVNHADAVALQVRCGLDTDLVGLARQQHHAGGGDGAGPFEQVFPLGGAGGGKQHAVGGVEDRTVGPRPRHQADLPALHRLLGVEAGDHQQVHGDAAQDVVVAEVVGRVSLGDKHQRLAGGCAQAGAEQQGKQADTSTGEHGRTPARDNLQCLVQR